MGITFAPPRLHSRVDTESNKKLIKHFLRNVAGLSEIGKADYSVKFVHREHVSLLPAKSQLLWGWPNGSLDSANLYLKTIACIAR